MKPYVSNGFNQAKNMDFINEIDNPKGIKHIENMLIGSLSREDGTTNGIVQLFNNKNPILKQDSKKFQAISGFFGGCIEKLEFTTKKLTTVVAIELKKNDARTSVQDCIKALDGDNAAKQYISLMKTLEVLKKDFEKQ